MDTGPKRRTVVVVIASSGDADDLRQLLDGGEVDVLAAGDVAAPLTPDLVVADVPHLAAVEQHHPGVPVLALVRRDAPDDVPAALTAGAVDVLALPCAPAEVAARVAVAARLSAAERRVGDLEAWAARASHDLATPLAIITMVAETMKAAWDRLDVTDRERLLASIRNQATRARELLDEAIALARGEEGSAPPRP